MVFGACRIVLLSLIGVLAAREADIAGTVLVTHKLTKRKVTAPASSYARGTAVRLGAEPSDDPLAFERTRVVIYL